MKGIEKKMRIKLAPQSLKLRFAQARFKFQRPDLFLPQIVRIAQRQPGNGDDDEHEWICAAPFERGKADLGKKIGWGLRGEPEPSLDPPLRKKKGIFHQRVQQGNSQSAQR